MSDHTATYSPEDNKIRIYPAYRLDADEYARVKAAGYKWAPRQEIFVAPMWTPERHDLAVEMCGEIGDEDTSLAERAEDRAERFEEYSDKRATEAERAHEYVQSITDGIPLGQPILVGHHSERHARKDAQQIENGMRKAVSLWETSSYWTRRAAGALRAAKYKELPAVRARRIKTLEADKRKRERNKAEAEKFLKAWLTIRDKDMEQSTRDAFALHVSGADFFYMCFPLADYPREPPASQYEGDMSIYSALERGIITTVQAADLVIPVKKRVIEHSERWISHYENRLAYEKAMLNEQGAADLIAPKARPKQLPLVNYRAPEGITLENQWQRGNTIHYSQIEMTKEEYAKAYSDDKGTREVEHSHRIRIVIKRGPNYSREWHCVFLTDSKEHTKPEPVAPKPVAPRLMPSTNLYKAPERTKFDDLKDSLKAGISTVSANQLFPTPQNVAEQMIDLADIQPGQRILEPSAGTGNLIKAMPNIRPSGHITAVEINQAVAAQLEPWADDVIIMDFLNLHCSPEALFDRIVMNPPFQNGDDIKHIKHAVSFLAPGGRLVALCAGGPRQEKELRPLSNHWETLPAGSFKSQGTGVNVVILVIDKE